MSNLVGEMLVGRVDFGESSQARSASYSAEDAMAVTIVRLYQEGDELRAEVAMLREQARILAEERDEARKKAERYRLEANAMMAQRDEAQRKVAELQAGLDDIEEYGTEEINAAVDLRHQLAAALCELSALRKEVNISAADVAVLKRRCDALKAERDEARIQYRSTEALAMALVKTIDELKAEKAELSVKLVNLEGRSRRATLDEIAESVREKYDERYEGEGMDNE